MKIISRVIIVLVVLALIPMLFSNRWLTRLAVDRIEQETGFQVAFGELHVGLLRPVIRIQDLVLSNPPDYPHPEALVVREVYVHYNRLSLLTDTIRLNELRLDVPRVVMVRPQEGGSNIEDLTRAGRSKPDSPQPTPPPAPEPRTSPTEPVAAEPAKSKRHVEIDQLTVKLGEMEVRQYVPRGSEPIVMTVPIGFDRSYQNVTNVQEVGRQIAVELLARSTVGVLGNLDQVLKQVTDESGKLDANVKDQLKELRNMFRNK
ncbi:MAG TPA: AsmA family protein [Kiritimatiellia bacterium]|nr:AsmA family protein [Kiritimatiellia bacterium]HMO99404.1 AsmA family protein [Kiritimatiellia bacterium]HMP97951.1 AsmA family protein [Kiritimatiellia bacterium]